MICITPEISRRLLLGCAVAAALCSAACVGVAAARASSDSPPVTAVDRSAYCGTLANPCPDDWYLLLDGTTIVTGDIPAAPFSADVPPVVGRGRPLEA